MGGGRPKDLGVIFKGGRTGSVDFRVRDVGPDPPYGAGPGKIPAQGCAADHQQASEASGGRGGYPRLEVEMEEVGFEEIGVYITRIHNKVAQYIATRSIVDLCERSVRRLGAWDSRRWWGQEELDLEGGGE